MSDDDDDDDDDDEASSPSSGRGAADETKQRQSATTTTTVIILWLILLVVGVVVGLSTTSSQSLLLPGPEEEEEIASPQYLSSFSMTRRRLISDDDHHQDLLAATHNTLLFHHDDEQVQVLGPTAFPKPTDVIAAANNGIEDDDVMPFLKPKIGQHRPEQDAVFAFAAEYELKRYVIFIESLRATGFQGDIVFTIAELDYNDLEIRNYLLESPNVVVYVPRFTCWDSQHRIVESIKGGMHICVCDGLYGYQTAAAAGNSMTPLRDARHPRTVAITRYEIYWIMASHYQAHSWILLVDSRDTYFQSNPFVDVPRHHTDPTGGGESLSGWLYLFGENVDATRLGKSKQNARWLELAYGNVVQAALENKPIICSGATMGEQIALDTYIRAIVAESDETQTVLLGADQGFHNFLYYSHKLKNAKRIHDIVVFDQGTGIVNNLGAMRTAPLDSWGNGHIIVDKDDGGIVVLNWDGTPSPVVHQYDRHKALQSYIYGTVARDMMKKKLLKKKHGGGG